MYGAIYTFGFSIAPLYLARIFLQAHAQECARTPAHTALCA